MIRRRVDAGNVDVLRALWPPADVTWLVAGLTIDPYARLLSVSIGPHAGCSTELLSLRYDVRAPEGERRAWRALKETLKGDKAGPR